MSKRQRRIFRGEFKQDMVNLYNGGKTRAEIIKEYELTPSAFDRWVRNAKAINSAKDTAIKSVERSALIKLREENQKLRNENNILRQAAMILCKSQL